MDLDPAAQSEVKELKLKRGESTETIDLRITRLMNPRGYFSGHMLILRDITAFVEQDEKILRYQADLERRVAERTTDLEAANAQLKAEVEQRRRTEQEKEIQRSEMEILYRLTVELSALPLDGDLENVISKRLKQLTGAFVVSLSEYNLQKKQLELRRLETDSSAIEKANRLMRRNVTELTFPVDDKTYAEMVEVMVGQRGSLTEATFGAVPAAVGKVLQKLFNLEMFIGMIIQDQGELMGTVMLILQKGQKAPSNWLLSALANVLSIIYRRKRAEVERRESENRFHSLAEMLPQPIYEADLSGQLIYANRKAFEMFGYAQVEPGLTILDLLAESEREEAAKNLRRIIENPAEKHTEYLARRKDGSTFPVLAYTAPIIRAGRLAGLRGVLVDFTELKSSEEALRSSEEKFRSIIEQSSEGVMLVGEDGRILELNHAFEKIYGMSKTELLGMPFWDITRRIDYREEGSKDPVEQAQENYQAIVSSLANQRITAESEFFTPDGHRRVIQRTAFPVKVSQGLRMAAVVSDITERKDAEREQSRLTRRLSLLSECNQALIRMDRDEDLLQAICKIFVDLGGYRFAWIRLTQELRDPTILPVISYGEAGDYLEKLTPPFETSELSGLRQYILEGLNTSRLTIISDIRTDPVFAPHRNETLKHGFLSVFIFPLAFGDELFGSLNIYGGEPFTGDPKELDLLTEMVNDVSFGIQVRRMQNDRDRAEQKALQANAELNQAYESTLEGWSRALELRERETAGHSQRVVDLTIAVARELGIPEESLIHLRRGALLHDIGKMGIPDHILLKPEPLSEEEWMIMRQHPQMAYNLLAKIPYLAPALVIPYSHHERWDGSGYPRGLKGEEIPLAARIFAVVDIWDALIYDRPYRPAWPKDAASAYLLNQAGKQLDPQVVREFLKLGEKDPSLFV